MWDDRGLKSWHWANSIQLDGFVNERVAEERISSGHRAAMPPERPNLEITNRIMDNGAEDDSLRGEPPQFRRPERREIFTVGTEQNIVESPFDNAVGQD